MNSETDPSPFEPGDRPGGPLPGGSPIIGLLTGGPGLRSVALVLLALALVPGAWPYWSANLEIKPHLQFVVLIPIAFLWLLSDRIGPARELERGNGIVVAALFGASALLLAGAIVAVSSLLWVASAVLAVLGVLWERGGTGLFRRVWPVWALLWLMTPPPMALDQVLVFRLQLGASEWASRLLDGWLGVVHTLEG
ncbi:MAG: exosortase/archaeosortase family protein, partial [Candidatus Riflebacteria bacterium]|nr:exosortase/archaeosortase family protein [Candidatus Riflebacteria bacterium]